MSEHSFEEHLANEDDFELRSRAKKRRVAVGIASAVANIASSIVSFAGRSFNYGGGRKSGAKTFKRDRVDIDKQIHQLDDRHFRRKYRMDKVVGGTIRSASPPHQAAPWRREFAKACIGSIRLVD